MDNIFNVGVKKMKKDKNFGREKRSEGGSRFGKKDSGRDSGFGRRERSFEMHKVTCAKCHKPCEVPFKPRGDKPVYCSDCFRNDGNNEGRSDSSERRNDYTQKESSSPAVDYQEDLDEINEKLDSLDEKLDELDEKMQKIITSLGL